MGKLTKTQIAILSKMAAGDTIIKNHGMGRYSNPSARLGKERENINLNTMEALKRQGLIQNTSTGLTSSTYSITNTGRTALAQAGELEAEEEQPTKYLYYFSKHVGKIETVEIKKETDGQYILTNNQRIRKGEMSDQWSYYYTTYEVAADGLRLHCRMKIESLQGEIDRQRGYLEALEKGESG